MHTIMSSLNHNIVDMVYLRSQGYMGFQTSGIILGTGTMGVEVLHRLTRSNRRSHPQRKKLLYVQFLNKSADHEFPQTYCQLQHFSNAILQSQLGTHK